MVVVAVVVGGGGGEEGVLTNWDRERHVLCGTVMQGNQPYHIHTC